MHDEVFIYVIIVLNTLVQLMLIRSLSFPAGGRWKYYMVAVGIPLGVMLSMRLLILGGVIPNRVANQSPGENYITTAAGILLVAGPWLATIAAIFSRKRKRAIVEMHSSK
jgi:hypothetical protein